MRYSVKCIFNGQLVRETEFDASAEHLVFPVAQGWAATFPGSNVTITILGVVPAPERPQRVRGKRHVPLAQQPLLA